MTSDAASLQQVRDLLLEARSVSVLTGAGISAESGIATFRSPGGLWRNFRPEQLATPEAFQQDPVMVWEWYEWRRQQIAQAQPNAGHLALVELERRTRQFTLVTQNVDGLHERAGSKNVLRLHGSIWRIRCLVCAQERDALETPLVPCPPRCACGGMMRPGVVWFGEGLDRTIWDNAEQAVRSADVLLVAGTSAVVYPAASLVPLAAQSGAKVVEINPEETPMSPMVHFTIRGRSGEVLPRLIS